MRVPPFGNLRIEAYLQLPAAYRSLSRPSSAPDAKAFTLCSCSLELLADIRISDISVLSSLELLCITFYSYFVCFSKIVFVLPNFVWKDLIFHHYLFPLLT